MPRAYESMFSSLSAVIASPLKLYSNIRDHLEELNKRASWTSNLTLYLICRPHLVPPPAKHPAPTCFQRFDFVKRYHANWDPVVFAGDPAPQSCRRVLLTGARLLRTVCLERPIQNWVCNRSWVICVHSRRCVRISELSLHHRESARRPEASRRQ